MQGTSLSSSMGYTDANSVQLKKANSGSLIGSLIDFTDDPEHPVAVATLQPIQQQNISPPSNGGDWASFDNAGQQKAPPASANSGIMESALSQLSTPGPAPTSQVSTLPTSGVGAYPKNNGMGQWPTTQQHQTSLFPADLSQSSNLPFNAPRGQASLFVCVRFVLVSYMLTLRGGSLHTPSVMGVISSTKYTRTFV